MGCDIHFYVERKVNGLWVTADKWSPNPYSPDVMKVDYKDEFYSGRNYDLFSILANVRNGYGFAGITTGAGFTPISNPKGVPPDCCSEYRKEVECWGNDGHSHSYLTLKEILSFDWTQKSRKTGVVSPIQWAYFRDNGSPNNWCGSVSGGNTRLVSQDIFEQAWQTLRIERGYPESRLAGYHLTNDARSEADVQRFIELAGGHSPYTSVEWVVHYYEQAKKFWSSTIPRMLQLGDPDDVRCVFFFDN
jgi:hypothetical protein